MSKTDLENQAAALGLDTSGTKAEIQARIDAHQQSQVPPPPTSLVPSADEMKAMLAESVANEEKKQEYLAANGKYDKQFKAKVTITGIDSAVKDSKKVGTFLMMKVSGIAEFAGVKLPVTLNTNLDYIRRVNLEVGQIVPECVVSQYKQDVYDELIANFVNDNDDMDEPRARTIIARIKFDFPKGYHSTKEMLAEVVAKRAVNNMFASNQSNAPQARQETVISPASMLESVTTA